MVKVLVFGMGSIGSLLAAYLSKVYDVYGVGRSWHIDEIRRRGYLVLRRVFSGEVEFVKIKEVFTNVDELNVKSFDYLFLTTKAYDVENSLRQIIEAGIDFGCLVLLQNGLGIGNIALKVLGGGNIVRG